MTKNIFAERQFQGLGLWNVYFILKFILAALAYLNLNMLANALFILFLLYPLKIGWLSRIRDASALLIGAILLYSETWLPGLDSLLGNAGNIAGFSLSYISELIIDFINWKLVGWTLALGILYLIVSPFIRVTVLTITYFLILLVSPLWADFTAPSLQEESLEVANDTEQAKPVTQVTPPAGVNVPANSETVAKWYSAFIDYEKERQATLPAGLNEKDTPFDIVIMNVCSLSNDDLKASDLETHPVLSRFNIRFDQFNSATSYSGPATLRLLNAVCGQPSHDGLYGEPRAECQIMNRLANLGYKQWMFLDHAGQYDNYLQTMREKAGLTATLVSGEKYPVRYIGFDDEPIADTLAVLRDWQKTIQNDDATRSVSFFNFIALHDGNRLPRQSHWEAFKPRAKAMFDELNVFFDELEKSGRKVMFIVVPEHGAAVQGDRIQAPRLRDIPSLSITQVPVLVKFFGLKDLPQEQIHVPGTTSYLALSTLIGKTLESNYFSDSKGAIPLDVLVKDLPETNPVSENAQSIVLRYRDRDYIRQKGDEWVVYPK